MLILRCSLRKLWHLFWMPCWARAGLPWILQSRRYLSRSLEAIATDCSSLLLMVNGQQSTHCAPKADSQTGPVRYMHLVKLSLRCSYYQERAGMNVGAVLYVAVGPEVWDRTALYGGFTQRSEDRCTFPLQKFLSQNIRSNCHQVPPESCLRCPAIDPVS